MLLPAQANTTEENEPASSSVTSPPVHEWVQSIHAYLSSKVRGKEGIIELTLSTFLGGGHVLVEGPPGTGKTSLAKAMAEAFGGTFRRIQMTSDLLPSDIVGVLRLVPGSSELEFRKGPIFANFLLADELNRTSSKTQSALLEAMAEGTVSVDGRTYGLPEPFFVMATQNPMEFQGVYPLAESQLDRFMLHLSLSPPEKKDEIGIYRSLLQERNPEYLQDVNTTRCNEHSHLKLAERPSFQLPVLSIHQTHELRKWVSAVHVEDTVLEYISDLVRATRVHDGVSHGVSVRGGIQFVSVARALAFVRGRDYVLPKDVKDLAVPVLAHRLCFSTGEPDQKVRHQVIHEILERVPSPK